MLLLDDMQLLQAYVAGSEEAFETILNRHVNLVYSTALRQVRDPDLASEVTQTTFIILARKAGRLGSETILSGWLYRTAQFAASRAIRTEVRRRERERESVLMQTEPSESVWEHLAPFLDQAMAHLGTADRNAIILRYFENKTAKDVGIELGINEAAAQKRLTRAVEKLRSFCTKKGVVLSAAGLTALLSANAVSAAPAGVTFATTTALKAGTMGPLTSGTLKLIAWAKLKFVALTSLGVATAAIGTAVCVHYANGVEPVYQKRSLGSWLTQLDNNQPTFNFELPWAAWETQIKRSPAQEEAATAIRAMGTNVVPQLLASLEATNLSFWEKMSGVPAGVINDRQRRAALALDALGSASKPWLSQFTDLSASGRCPKESAMALAAMGPEGWAVLVKNLSATNEDAASCAIWAVGSHRIALPGAEQALLAIHASNRPAMMDIVALWALLQINYDHQALIPMLVDGLRPNQRPDVRWGSAFLLGKLGADADGVLPELKGLIDNKNRTIRLQAAQAIREIDPQAAAQAGIADQSTELHIPKTTIF